MASRSCWRPAPPIRRCCWSWAACVNCPSARWARAPGAAATWTTTIRSTGPARPVRALQRVAVPLLRRRHHPHRRGPGTGAQLRGARLLGQPQPGLPVAGHRCLPAVPAGHPLPVRRRVDQRRAAA
ncbi:hypothetical protein G6F50_016118 [Rhizopus delemar]|uniref:Uncharacterized protein n=1 Tax=Rhizopus delemar TaxID=936053 RepID=A0A9P7C2B5_9FUNG|nr:hypothetical protein G6F50_016118 [Rhizopus delemar]